MNVLKNSETGDIVHEFRGDNDFDGTGMYIVDAGSLDDFVFVDQVSAANKPTATPGTPGDNGILVKASNATGGHLKIEGTAGDDLLRITESTATSATVEARDGASTGNSRFGAGVNQLTIQTHNNGGAQVRVATREFSGQPGLPGLHPNTALRIESLGVGDLILLGGGDDASVHATIHTGAGNNLVHLYQDNEGDGTTTAIVDFDPNLGGALGSGNKLFIATAPDTGANCTATLARVSGTDPHTITLDLLYMLNGGNFAPNADTPATVIIEDPTRLGEARLFQDDLTPAGDPIIFVNAPLTVEKTQWTSGKVYIGGRMDFAPSSKPSTVYMFEVGIKKEHNPFELLAWGDARGVVNLNQRDPDPNPPDDLTVQFDSRIPLLNIWAGPRFTFQRRSDTPAQENARVLTLKELFIEKDPMAPEGILDLKDNSMIINYVGDSPLEDVRKYITQAYDTDPMATTHWITNSVLRNGINSSIAATRTDVGIGYAEATDLFTTYPATFEGQSVDNTSVLVKYTFYGDANLTGNVNLQDFNRLAANFGLSNKRWSQGDFNYNLSVTLADFNLLAGNFGAGGQAEEYTYEELEEMLPD